ncbi:MAG TPA: peptidyl-prolyl cis-trans isomerase [Pyrinomonadaceae bacterium]|nr:peptidyl-prolyl cis-trans isomerase [Pyrinomonadaceae bacterium]
MKFINSAIFLVAVLFFPVFSAFAQESEPVVIDEVIAQVNEGVVTLSRIKREMKEAIDGLVRQGKTPEAARAEVESRQGELIANIINEELILQKGKELGVDVEGDLNQRFLQIMKEQNIKTLEALKAEMRKAGIDPDELREAWRKQITRDYVLQREVDSKIYFGLTSKEIKDYYEKNKAKFSKPATVTLSEIFLSFAGRDENAVMEKAKKLVAELRAGADFTKLAVENSERPNVRETKGKLQTFKLDELTEVFAVQLKAAKVGGVTDPIRIDEGVEILRVDARQEASSESVFDDDAVRKAMTYERLPEERKKFMATLRKESYIKISESYKPLVAPLLFEDERKAEVKKPTE